MGLFSRRKKIEVPLPPPEELLRFPKSSSIERSILPEKIKEAVGLSWEKPAAEGFSPSSSLLPPLSPEISPSFRRPFFIRAQHYQEILKELDGIRSNCEQLEHNSAYLEQSEFNENKDYESLKNDLKRIQERLLHIDEIIFKK